MAISNTIRPGRHFLQIPGPTNVPDRVLRAMDYPTIDHRGPDFAELGLRVLDRIKLIFKTSEPNNFSCIWYWSLGSSNS